MTRSLRCCWVFLPQAFFFSYACFQIIKPAIQHIMVRHALLHNVIKDGSDFARQNKASLELTDLWNARARTGSAQAISTTLFPKGELHAQKAGFCLQSCFQKFHVM